MDTHIWIQLKDCEIFNIVIFYRVLNLKCGKKQIFFRNFKRFKSFFALEALKWRCPAIVRCSNDPAHTDYVTRASNRGLFLLWFPIGERSVPGVKGFFLGAAVKPLTLVKGASGSPMKNSEGEKNRNWENGRCPSEWPIMLFDGMNSWQMLGRSSFVFPF